MEYVHNITSKGQVTLPKELRDRAALDAGGKATFRLNKLGEIVVARPKTLAEVRTELAIPTRKDPLSKREGQLGSRLAKKYGVR